MLGLSWTELMVVGVVALIVIGPKDLPVVMGRIGKFVGQIQRMGREFQREINKTTGLDEVRNLRSSITDPLRKTADEIRREFNAIGKDGQQSPTGALKPTDPKVESVADAIKEQAGMAPAKSSTELAGEYGFKPTAAKPVAGTRTTPPTFEDTAAAKAAKASTDLSSQIAVTPPTTLEEAAPVMVPVEPVKAKRPRAPRKTASPPLEVTGAIPAKPAPKPRKKASAGPAAAETPVEPAPKKPRAPRKKPADTAGES
ncbi:Sec-independent protein translocase subunit TatA/TatB [Devosia chinhatensis]|uniref:Sec-independent protein translocase protein TatB n=1 Tax=Devosia chinhatensis TaxID=429727 RepID=A0A0F5FKM4_9HYPH|nr:twin-arginine translocase TatA/TatE family subunit [Devosia chinhatensis]KKB09449.1 hypothetical protein VE26_05855 [Devosia chinhatensis]